AWGVAALAAHTWRPWLARRTHAREPAAVLARLRLLRLSVPVWIPEMVVCPHEVVDGEVILALVESRSPPDDLLELDQRPDRPHEHDVPDVPGIHAGRQLLRRRQDRGYGLL